MTAVSHRFVPGPWVLDEVELRVADDEVVALMGPSGSGKTTLLAVIGGMLAPVAGHVTLDGRPVVEAVRSLDISWILQTTVAVPHRSALDNVAIGRLARGDTRPAARAVARAALDTLGLGALAGRTAGRLSGGELQRVGVARGLVSSPRLLLADEPTAQLDRRSALTVADALVALRPTGTMVLIATHDPLVADRADRVLTLRDGRLTP